MADDGRDGSQDRRIGIRILGRPALVPERTRLLDSFATLCPETVPQGKFCRNQECGNSKFYYRLPGDPQERKARACTFPVVEGMEVTVLSAELRSVLAPFLSRVEDHGDLEPEPEPEAFPVPRFRDGA